MPSNLNDQSQAAEGAYKLTVRFGDEILQAGFTTVPNLLLRYQAELEITSAELNFILQVWYHWWDQKDPYPSLGAIGDRMASSRRQVRRYSESLRLKDYLVVRERKAEGLGQVTSEYDFSKLLEKLRQLYRGEQIDENEPRRTKLTRPPRTNLTEGGRTNLTEAPRSRMTPKEYKEQEYPLEQYTTGSKGNISLSRELNAPRFSKKSVSKQQNSAPDDLEDPDRRSTRAAQPSLQPIGELITHRQALAYAAVAPSDQPPAPRRRKKAAPEATPQIEHLLKDFSAELHDEEHTAQNISQAARLWQASGRPESAFCQLMYEARALTKQYRVKKRATGPGGAIGLRNKMPYFFSVLKDLLGMKPQPLGTASQAPPG
jgi:hypothetical protein